MQTETIYDHRNEYERLFVYQLVILDNIMEEIFVKRLKSEIQTKMSRENYVSLRAIIGVAINAEKRLNTLWQA